MPVKKLSSDLHGDVFTAFTVALVESAFILEIQDSDVADNSDGEGEQRCLAELDAQAEVLSLHRGQISIAVPADKPNWNRTVPRMSSASGWATPRR